MSRLSVVSGICLAAVLSAPILSLTGEPLARAGKPAPSAPRWQDQAAKHDLALGGPVGRHGRVDAREGTPAQIDREARCETEERNQRAFRARELGVRKSTRRAASGRHGNAEKSYRDDSRSCPRPQDDRPQAPAMAQQKRRHDPQPEQHRRRQEGRRCRQSGAGGERRRGLDRSFNKSNRRRGRRRRGEQGHRHQHGRSRATFG